MSTPNLKGAPGENFLKKKFKGIKLISHHEISPRISIKERLETFGTTLPDFLVKGTNIFIAVKTGKSAALYENQLKSFLKILKNGGRIFIVKPKLITKKKKVGVIDYYCAEFLGKKKRRKISLDQLKKIIKNAISSTKSAIYPSPVLITKILKRPKHY